MRHVLPWVVCAGGLLVACDGGSPLVPTAPSSLRSIIVGEVIRARVTVDDPLCDREEPTHCQGYSFTTTRDGLLDVTLAWSPSTPESAVYPLGFAVIDPTGRHWYPVEPGRVSLQATNRSFYRIRIWSLPNEEYVIRTSLR